MKVIGIDPGSEHSGLVACYIREDDVPVITTAEPEADNYFVVGYLATGCDVLIIEDIVPYGVMGRTLLETVRWTGRFQQAAVSHSVLTAVHFPRRADVCLALTGQQGSKASVNTYLRDTYGNPGTKKSPGVLYQLRSHAWDAFALVAWWMKMERAK